MNSHVLLVCSPDGELAAYGPYRVHGEGVYASADGARYVMAGTIDLIEAIAQVESWEYSTMRAFWRKP